MARHIPVKTSSRPVQGYVFTGESFLPCLHYMPCPLLVVPVLWLGCPGPFSVVSMTHLVWEFDSQVWEVKSKLNSVLGLKMLLAVRLGLEHHSFGWDNNLLVQPFDLKFGCYAWLSKMYMHGPEYSLLVFSSLNWALGVLGSLKACSHSMEGFPPKTDMNISSRHDKSQRTRKCMFALQSNSKWGTVDPFCRTFIEYRHEKFFGGYHVSHATNIIHVG